MLDASEIYPRRINAKEIWITQKMEKNSYSQSQMVRHNGQGETTDSEKSLRGPNRKDKRENQEMTLMPGVNFWFIQGDFIYLHHNEFRVQLHMLKEETFPIPRKYFDVTRFTHTDLDVRRNVLTITGMSIRTEVCQFLGKVWKNFHCWKRNLQKDMWSGERLTKVQTTPRPDHVWPEEWSKIGKAAQNREKQEWKCKPNLDNTRRLRRIYFLEPGGWWGIQGDYQECKEKLEVPMGPTMPCKKEIHWLTPASENCCEPQMHLKRFRKMVESHESTRPRAELSQITQITWLTKDMPRWRIKIWYTSLFQYHKQKQIPDVKAAVDKEWKKLETTQPGNWRKSEARRRLFLKHKERKQVHFAARMDMCHLKNAEIEPQFQKKNRGRVVLRGDIVKDDSGTCTVFSEQGSSASQTTAAKVMDGIARLPYCDGHADAVSACTPVKL